MSNTLRSRFTVYLTVQRKAKKTKEAYLRVISGLAGHYQRSPDRLTNAQIQEYLRYLLEERLLSWSSSNVALSAMVCFYRGFLGRSESYFRIPPRPRCRQLPEILSVGEVERLLAATANLKHLALLKTAYCAGLRVSEVVNLKPKHIESAPDRMLIRVEQGKGRKDRYTVLTADCLETLRRYWQFYKPEQWLFPGANRARAMSISAAQRIYEAAKKKPV